jgi:hypothetical protein
VLGSVWWDGASPSAFPSASLGAWAKIGEALTGLGCSSSSSSHLCAGLMNGVAGATWLWASYLTNFREANWVVGHPKRWVGLGLDGSLCSVDSLGGCSYMICRRVFKSFLCLMFDV